MVTSPIAIGNVITTQNYIIIVADKSGPVNEKPGLPDTEIK